MYDDLLTELAVSITTAPVKAPLIANKPQAFNDRLVHRDETLDRIYNQKLPIVTTDG